MSSADLKKIASTRELILALVVVVFVFIVFFQVIYSPKSKQLDEMKTQIKDLDTQQKSLVSQVDALKLKQEKQQQTKESIANIKVMILKRDQPPVMTDSVALIEYIVEVGRKEGLIFDGMTSKTPDGKSNLSRIPITMKAHGPYKAITNFLQKLDTVEALFVIDTLLITSDPTKNVEASLDARGVLFQVEGIHAKETTK
ncbi:MAG: hypothetical protein ACD_73C00072G0002 [uncultured bacterium]|nr:MAG: hypothetical protein ACD_73C00072G0002 [uncultured bacterium]